MSRETGHVFRAWSKETATKHSGILGQDGDVAAKAGDGRIRSVAQLIGLY